jgi:hypothetical protein
LEVEKLKEKIQRKIERNNERIKELEGNKEILSKHGYWDLGYFEGANTALENILDDLE